MSFQRKVYTSSNLQDAYQDTYNEINKLPLAELEQNKERYSQQLINLELSETSYLNRIKNIKAKLEITNKIIDERKNKETKT
ncbi:hypothetical protein Fleli_0603 [Bernardetia litoralis DSM 6794]|uniref:50S ribosomal protein L29 n=1 Tax=Bernardetia litoralis (strain ATCC 23117 / DSM 6794 / NBRC 15988 / NCIMB 1366 / Fx l1 / Sio-4) TaxID=880071 RepID=I4AGI2_BERLS|nr:hypothetical protein [Bernardetia litoralis]AFM03067.1 hypothetical protein Fleli_0603 [Bernardetia litoralis DSM 6794]